MKAYVGHIEALRYAYAMRDRLVGCRRVTIPRLDDADTVTRAADIAALADALAAAGIVAPRAGDPGTLLGPNATEADGAGCHHVLVPRGRSHGTSAGVVRHSCATALPANAFMLVGNGIYVSTPEFSWLQLAGGTSTVRLIRLGCALCASYRISDEGDIVSAVPVTTPARLASFVSAAAGVRGVGAARAALPYVVAGAESPPEIAAYMLLCLPSELGGLGAAGARLNHEIAVDTPERAVVVDRPDRRAYRIDLAWVEEAFGVEYLGSQHDAQVDDDRERMNALVGMGMRVLQVKHADLARPKPYRRLGAQVLALLGRSAPEESPQYLRAHDALLSELFGALSPKL